MPSDYINCYTLFPPKISPLALSNLKWFRFKLIALPTKELRAMHTILFRNIHTLNIAGATSSTLNMSWRLCPLSRSYSKCISIFRRNALKAYLPYACRLRSCSFGRHEISPWNISRTVWPSPESPKCTWTSTPTSSTVYSYTRYYVIVCFRSEIIAKKTVENTASDRFGWNFSRTV